MELEDKTGMKSRERKIIYQGGFTITEIMIVLSLLSIVALIALPSFHHMAVNGHLKSAARDLASDVALLKERALSENRMYRISLNLAGGTYTLQQCNTPGSPCASWTSIQNKNFLGLAGNIDFDSGYTTVMDYSFQPRGIVTSGTIALRNGRGSTATINISPSGRQNVQLNLR